MGRGGRAGGEGAGGVPLTFVFNPDSLSYICISTFFLKCTSSVGGYGIMGRGGKVS